MEELKKVHQNLKSFWHKLYNGNPQSTYIEFDDFFGSEIFINFFGFNNLPRDVPINRSRERRTFFTFSMINTTIFVIINIISIIYGLSQGGSFLVITENVAIVCIEGLVLIKGFTTMYWYQKRLMEIVVKLNQHFPHDAWNQHVFDVPQHLKTLRICGTICSVLYKSVLVEFATMPIFIQLYGLVFSQEVELQLIIKLQLPVDTKAPITYTVLYFINIWAFVVGTFTVLITDLLFAELVAVINMELMILGQRMSEIDASEGQNEAADELKKLSETHQELIELSEDLKDILSPLLFIDCFGMTITICCCAFLTLSGISTFFLLKYVLALIGTSWNSFIHCFYGSRLNDASLSVADGAYNCNWISGNTKFRKMILTVMVRARKAQKLTGMQFANVNLETFQWIIQAAYSYYSVLKAVYKP